MNESVTQTQQQQLASAMTTDSAVSKDKDSAQEPQDAPAGENAQHSVVSDEEAASNDPGLLPGADVKKNGQERDDKKVHILLNPTRHKNSVEAVGGFCAAHASSPVSQLPLYD